MIHNVGDVMVEIEGYLFPAANIQVLAAYPEIEWSCEHEVFYGLYFDVMFENGYTATVRQSIVDDNMCYDGETTIEHFLVEITRMQDDYKEVVHAYHCVGEEALAETLLKEMRINKHPQGTELLVGGRM